LAEAKELASTPFAQEKSGRIPPSREVGRDGARSQIGVVVFAGGSWCFLGGNKIDMGHPSIKRKKDGRKEELPMEGNPTTGT